jgi:DNA-binding MarR family transcriptional regulator
MGDILRQRLRQTRFDTPIHEAMLNLLVAAGHIRDLLDRAFDGHDITPAQYNVLRILKGAQPRGYPRCEIGRRLIERAPDLTRMIDRLETRGLVERTRSETDHRHSVTRITRKGLDLLDQITPGVEAIHRRLGRRFPRREALELSRLCERLYEGQPEHDAEE